MSPRADSLTNETPTSATHPPDDHFNTKDPFEWIKLAVVLIFLGILLYMNFVLINGTASEFVQGKAEAVWALTVGVIVASLGYFGLKAKK